jgi:23S rRNA pseudoU1915 N3-methylase RlmH
MKIRLISITKRRGSSKESAVDALTAEYVKRAARYSPVEMGECASEEALLKSLERPGRTAPVLVALDSRGKQWSSDGGGSGAGAAYVFTGKDYAAA